MVVREERHAMLFGKRKAKKPTQTCQGKEKSIDRAKMERHIIDAIEHNKTIIVRRLNHIRIGR
jgi:hypothetical protein